MEGRYANRRADLCQKGARKTRMDSRGGSGVLRGAALTHNGYPLAPEKNKIKREWMWDYQKTTSDELGLKQNRTKLVLTLQDKKNYVVHYRIRETYSFTSIRG